MIACQPPYPLLQNIQYQPHLSPRLLKSIPSNLVVQPTSCVCNHVKNPLITPHSSPLSLTP
uniref:Putative ovule protein n=1 Tax=Solanum chacoense TaxID=4108 RepID=A0A0V0HZP6_SOLCH